MEYYFEYMLLIKKLQNPQEKYTSSCSMQIRKNNKLVILTFTSIGFYGIRAEAL